MKKFNILDFGARSDDALIQTEQIQSAIDECFVSGGGEVVIPKGKFVIGDIRLRSNITLHLLEGAELLGSTNPDDYLNILSDVMEPLDEAMIKAQVHWDFSRIGNYEDARYIYDNPANRWNYAMIKIVNAENVSIIGENGSVIDGRNCFDSVGEEDYRGPHGVNSHNSSNLYFSGYTMKNTGNWAHCIFSGSNIKVENVTVLGGHDGVHFRSCDNVIVRNCIIKTGDDCVAGFDNLNMCVSDCVFNGACNVFRLGGANILIENCDAYGPSEYPFRGSLTADEKKNMVADTPNTRKNLASFFTYMVDKSRILRCKPVNIKIKNCRVNRADRFFRLNLSGTEKWQVGPAPDGVILEDIICENVKHWIVAYGAPDSPLGLKMKNITYSADPEYSDMALMHCGNYDRIELENITVKGLSANTLIRTWGEAEHISAFNVTLDGNAAYELVSVSDEDFDTRFI